MSTKIVFGLVVSGSISLVALEADAVTVYTANYPPLNASSEINGSLGANTGRSFVASGMMGAKFYGNKNVAGMESSILATCQSKTPAGSTWPESCDFAGLIGTLNATFNENWVPAVYDSSSQSNAIIIQINGLKIYHSPALMPLYGHADHWATAYEVSVDSTGNLLNVKFFDGGSNVFADGTGDSYADGITQMSATTWKSVYFLVLNSVSSSDPYFNKYLLSIDPPEGTENRRTIGPVQLGLSASPGILQAGEQMSAELAQERVWSALFAAQVNEDDGMWSAIADARPGVAWEVAGFAPSGEPWDYYLVPMLDMMSNAVALVQMSVKDGSLEQIWVGSRPLPFVGVTPMEAERSADELLTKDEVLQGGELTWDPQADHPHTMSPMFPYYEFSVVGDKGQFRGEVIVTLHDGVAHRVEPPLAAALPAAR